MSFDRFCELVQNAKRGTLFHVARRTSAGGLQFIAAQIGVSVQTRWDRVGEDVANILAGHQSGVASLDSWLVEIQEKADRAFIGKDDNGDPMFGTRLGRSRSIKSAWIQGTGSSWASSRRMRDGRYIQAIDALKREGFTEPGKPGYLFKSDRPTVGHVLDALDELVNCIAPEYREAKRTRTDVRSGIPGVVFSQDKGSVLLTVQTANCVHVGPSRPKAKTADVQAFVFQYVKTRMGLNAWTSVRLDRAGYIATGAGRARREWFEMAQAIRLDVSSNRRDRYASLPELDAIQSGGWVGVC